MNKNANLSGLFDQRQGICDEVLKAISGNAKTWVLSLGCF